MSCVLCLTGMIPPPGNNIIITIIPSFVFKKAHDHPFDDDNNDDYDDEKRWCQDVR